MEVIEESTNPVDEGCAAAIARRKRTKRQRLQTSPTTLTEASLSSSTSSAAQFSDTTTTTTTVDEVDMANCLILLAQGRAPNLDPTTTVHEVKKAVKSTSRRFPNAPDSTKCVIYKCNACHKCFSSFQALGGHCAGHKKPKLSVPPPPPTTIEAKTSAIYEDCIQLNLNSIKSRIHECSVCKAEFASGQALGGHMRRHRPPPPPPLTETKQRSSFSLDLNLPASTDDQISAGNYPKSSTDSSTTIPVLSFPISAS